LNKSVVRFVLLGLLVVAALVLWHWSSRRVDVTALKPLIDKRAAMVARHTFDAAAQPADMPPLVAPETAECDTDFISNASVSGRSKKVDSTHAGLR